MTASADQEITLDRFQLEAIAHIDAGRSVLVAAPTGAGKTLVAEHAIGRALSDGARAFYTTPIKALSNQKYRDLALQFGSAQVGLLTGDNVLDPDADVVVMTTEVLRNMLYAGRRLDRLAVVVLDEVHYLEDSFRGPVWEEVILNLPEHVSLVCLSATVSNTDELGGWLESARGPTGVVIETERPVELTNLYAVGDRRGDRLHVLPTLVDERPNPEGHRFDPDRGRQRNSRHRSRKPWRAPKRVDLIDVLMERDLLPVIWFVFSRKGCDEAATAMARDGVRLTSPDEVSRIRAIARDRLAGLDAADEAVLDADGWLASLERGIAAHHAGLVPAFKETIEECFAEGLVRVVFATETLALGVNLPARSVVIDKLTKFTGEGHEALTPGQFTQLTGRAGRRGIDERGHAIVPWSPFTTFAQVAALAGSRNFELRSAFRPTYNMATNLLTRLDSESVRRLLARSFAQYQADTSRQDPDAIADAVSRLRPGDVVTGEDGERLAVLGVSWRRGGRARVRLLDPGGHDVRWELAHLRSSPHTVGHIKLPAPMAPNQPAFRSEVARALRRMRISGRSSRAAEIAEVKRNGRNQDSGIARRFEAVAAVLREREHLDQWRVTESGELVARIYHDLDLLVAETLAAGLLDDLDPPTLAGVVSAFTHEHRSPAPPAAVWFPSKIGRVRFDAIERLASDIRRAERRHGLPESRPPEAGFVVSAHAWAAGDDLASLLDADLSAGDFVRNVKQLVDLLRQMAATAPVAATRSSAAGAADRLHRGVVAMAGTVGE